MVCEAEQGGKTYCFNTMVREYKVCSLRVLDLGFNMAVRGEGQDVPLPMALVCVSFCGQDTPRPPPPPSEQMEP